MEAENVSLVLQDNGIDAKVVLLEVFIMLHGLVFNIVILAILSYSNRAIMEGWTQEKGNGYRSTFAITNYEW